MSASHRDTQDTIPWLVNGRIGDDERRAFDAHLQTCAECRAELALQTKVQAAMTHAGSEPRIEYAPSASLQKLWRRIGTDDIQPPTAKPTMRQRSRLVQWLVAAVIVEAVGVTLLATRTTHEGDSAYRTVTSESTASRQPVGALRVVFADSLTQAELNTLLRTHSLSIVNGPTTAGVYTLSVADGSDARSALMALRSSAQVRFAEPSGDAP